MYINVKILQLPLIFVFFYICRPVKIASVQKAVEKVTSTPLEENPVTIDIEHEEEDVKPLILPEQVQTENKAGGGPCSIEMECLMLRPVCDKLPTARRGRPFRSSNAPGQKRALIHKNKESDNIQGDANIQIETSSCNEWLVKEGLASPPPKHKDNYLLTMKVEDITSEDSEGTSEKQGVDQVETSDKNVENEVEERTKNVKMQLDFLTQEVEDMISKGEGEAECLEKVERLQMILKLLDEEKRNQEE